VSGVGSARHMDGWVSAVATEKKSVKTLNFFCSWKSWKDSEKFRRFWLCGERRLDFWASCRTAEEEKL